jgi:hypothetical protein
LTDEELEREYAERYAVASIIYYGSPGRCTGMTDAQYDGFADWLRQRRSWLRVAWLEESMLTAGSGYDLTAFPAYLHERARDQLERLCDCLKCMAGRGDITDPEVLALLGKVR